MHLLDVLTLILLAEVARKLSGAEKRNVKRM